MIMTKRQAVFPAGRQALYDKYKYSAAIRSGDLLFVSGQVGSREDGTPEPDFERQVELAFENLKAVLKAAGCTIGDVVDVTTFHTDPESQLDTMLKVRDRYLGERQLGAARPISAMNGLMHRGKNGFYSSTSSLREHLAAMVIRAARLAAILLRIARCLRHADKVPARF
jgi:enamine deaminase RidA (YjgF/YER057c/UK114 family)